MMRKDEKRLIHRALDGEVTQSETRILKRKLETDGRARAEFEQLKKVVRDTGRVRIDVPQDFTRKVLQETRRLRPPRPQA
jgi:anti-sigma factor RsiW